MVVVPQKCHTAVAVDRGCVVQIAGPEEVRKECPCMVSSAAKCRTWRAEDEVLCVGHKDVLQSCARATRDA